MLKLDEKSNAQAWELEVLCKNREYLNKVMEAVLSFGFLEFEVNIVEVSPNSKGEYEGIYTVFIWAVWFNNLSELCQKLEVIEKEYEKY